MIEGAWRALKPGGLFISKTTCLAEMTSLIRLAVPVMRVIGKAPCAEPARSMDHFVEESEQASGR